MYLIVLLLAASALYAEDLALEIRAQTDFDRIELSAAPRLSDALACVQSEAAVLPVTAPADLSLIHFRKGYCTLLDGILSGDPVEDLQAADEFEQAIQKWPARSLVPVSPALPVLAAIAAWKGGAPAAPRDFPADACPAALMPVSECRALLDIGRLWQGWSAAQQGRLADAARIFHEFPDSGWPAWMAGRQELAAHRYPEAAASLADAVRIWTAFEKNPPAALPALLKPAPDLAQALSQLGQAQLLAGQYAAALSSFDAALQRQPRDAWTIFLRGRAHDTQGQDQPAQADYELASRTAFAEVGAPYSSGQAHFYHGVRLFRRNDFARAEEAFASALNFGPGPDLKPDVMGWWRMAAVAGGGCHVSLGLLESSLATVSDFFPKPEAQDLIRNCRHNARAAVCYSAAIWDPLTK